MSLDDQGQRGLLADVVGGDWLTVVTGVQVSTTAGIEGGDENLQKVSFSKRLIFYILDYK